MLKIFEENTNLTLDLVEVEGEPTVVIVNSNRQIVAFVCSFTSEGIDIDNGCKQELEMRDQDCSFTKWDENGAIKLINV